jgi:hypothetical protein
MKRTTNLSIIGATLVLAAISMAQGCGGAAGNPVTQTTQAPSEGPAEKQTTLANASSGETPPDPSRNPDDPAETTGEAGEPAAADSGTAQRTPPEPATNRDAAQVIDLRKFPRLNATRELMSDSTHLWYSSKSSVASAAAYHTTELTGSGWKRVAKDLESTPSSQYVDLTFQKDDFYLRLSIGETGDEGIVSVDIVNNGNVDTRLLPKYPDSQVIPVDPTNANYRTSAEMADVVAFCRKELSALGWQQYEGFNADPTEVPEHKMLRFAKNAVCLDVSVSDVSKVPLPEFPNTKTHVAYMLTGMLAHDVPVLPEASDLKLDIYPWRLRFESPAPISELVDFYRSSYDKLGWKSEDGQEQIKPQSAWLVFSGPNDVHFLVDIRQNDGNSVVLATQVALDKKEASVAESKPENRPEPEPTGETVAQTKPEKRPVSDPQPPPPEPDDEPKTRKGKDTLGDTLAVPKGATEVARESELGMITFRSADDAKKIAEFYRSALKTLGWREVKLGSLVQGEFAALTFEKGEDTLTIAVMDGKPESRSRTIIQGETLWPEEKPEPTPPAKTAKSRDTKPPTDAAPKKEHQKLPNKGTIWIGDKSFKLDHVVAYRTKYADDDVTAIVFLEKAPAANKLQSSLKKNPPSDDFAGFQPHVKLIVDESDKLIYYFLYAEGVSINRGGTPDPDEITTETTVHDGYASGKVAMKKPGEFFDKSFRFETTFYAQLQNDSASPPAKDDPAGPEELVADEHDGLPIPNNTTNRQTQGSRFRTTLQSSVPADLKSVVEFYRRELIARGWKENAGAAKIQAEEAALFFIGPEGEMTLRLERAGKETTINLAARYSAKAKAAGILPPPKKSRIMLGNASEKPATIVINGKEYKVAAGVGAKDPKTAISLDVEPGKYQVSLKPRGSDEPSELVMNQGETWGVIVFPTGDLFTDQLY